jgi:excisionase family DNA binding protein
MRATLRAAPPSEGNIEESPSALANTRIFAINKATGEVVWERKIAEPALGETLTVAPLFVRDLRPRPSMALSASGVVAEPICPEMKWSAPGGASGGDERTIPKRRRNRSTGQMKGGKRTGQNRGGKRTGQSKGGKRLELPHARRAGFTPEISQADENEDDRRISKWPPRSGSGPAGRSVPRLHTIDETAEILSVSARTVRRLISSGALPAHRLPGRLIRISDGDIAAFLAATRSF